VFLCNVLFKNNLNFIIVKLLERVPLHQTYYSPRSLDDRYGDAPMTYTCIHIDSSKLVFKKELILTKDIVHYKVFKIIIPVIIIDT
jgi:hypothetical protein